MQDSPEQAPRPAAWQHPFDRTTFALAALASGAILWNALFPSFYYMSWLSVVLLFWAGLAAFVVFRLVIAGIGAQVTGRPVSSRGWRSVAGLTAFVTVVAVSRLPLHAGFALARADFDLAMKRDLQPGESFPLMNSRYGPYSIIQRAQRRCHHDSRVYFTLANDTEAGFVHSPDGVEDLCYNSGNTGHLVGDWYWMAED